MPEDNNQLEENPIFITMLSRYKNSEFKEYLSFKEYVDIHLKLEEMIFLMNDDDDDEYEDDDE